MDYTRFLDYAKKLVQRQMEGISWYLFAEAVCIILIVAVVLFLFFYFTKRKVNWVILLGFFFLAVYLCFVYQITYYNREAGSRVGFFTQIQTLNPKSGNTRENIYNLLNVILFVPIGMALTLIWSRKRVTFRCLAIPLYGFTGSMCIECIQFATSRGYFEVVDLITNTFGTIVGALCVELVLEIAKLCKEKRTIDEE